MTDMIFPQHSEDSGFTLLEVLVAMIIISLVVVVFLQLITSGIKLEGQADNSLEQIQKAQAAFDALSLYDIKDSDFVMQGQLGEASWKLRIKPIETSNNWEDLDDQEFIFDLSTELYMYIFEYTSPEGKKIVFYKYQQYEKNHFDESFIRDAV